MSKLEKTCQLFFEESRKNIALAIPMIMGQVGQLALSVVDTIMVGHVGVEPLAGVSFGGGLILFCFIIAMGLCTPVHVYVSKCSANKDHKEAGEFLKHGVWIVLCYSIPLALLVTFGINGLRFFGQPEEVLVHAKPYTIYLAWSIVPGLLVRAFRNYSEAWNRAWGPFYVTSAVILINVFLNWVFIFGHLGAPAMGAAGAGLATFISRVIGLILIVLIIFKNPFFDFTWGIKGFFTCQWGKFKQMLGVGIPTMVQIAFEFGFFTVATIMMGWIGTDELAVQQIVTNYTAILFMIPLGISFAVTIRISHAMERKDVAKVKAIGVNGVVLGTSFMAVIAICTYLLRSKIPLFFIDDESVVLLASTVLFYVALMQVFDGIQVTAMAALRGIPDVKKPLIMVIISYWVISTPLGYYAAFHLKWGAAGIWSGIVLGLVLTSLILLARFLYMIKKLELKITRRD